MISYTDTLMSPYSKAEVKSKGNKLKRKGIRVYLLANI